MAAWRLRSEASVALLLADVFVIWFAGGVARDSEAPMAIRLGFLAVVVLGVVLAVRSAVLLLRRRRDAQPSQT